MESYFINPFDSNDPDRRQIWEMLVARDSEAFAARDWKRVENDFIPERFEGISANGSDNPDDWTLKFPTLESYRDDWLRQGVEYAQVPLAAIAHRDLVFKLTEMNEIEIEGDRAICHKKFFADEPLKNGERFRLSAQTIYRLHRVGKAWKIAGFVGYLPFPMGKQSGKHRNK
jgi:hypothetical protein